MKLQTNMLSDLVKKFEKSSHFRNLNSSQRTVFLSKEKGEMKGYRWENTSSLETFAQEAIFLEGEGLVKVQWEVAEKVISRVTLQLENVEKAYRFLSITPPWKEAEEIVLYLEDELASLSVIWLKNWRDSLIDQINTIWKPPFFWKKGTNYRKNFCQLLCYYDKNPSQEMSLRQFSIQVFHNSKDLERLYLDDFLRVLREIHPELSEIHKETPLSATESLFLLGLSPREELYSLSGNLMVQFTTGTVDVGATGVGGLALPAFSCENLEKIQVYQGKQLIFIENKTNYDVFRLSKTPEQAVIYHGGFYSQRKGQFFRKVAEFLPENLEVYFWGDIDLGGFLMFDRLREIFPQLRPYAMGAEEVVKYAEFGLERSEEYLKKLKNAQDSGRFPLFRPAIEEILRRGVTIEQEVML